MMERNMRIAKDLSDLIVYCRSGIQFNLEEGEI